MAAPLSLGVQPAHSVFPMSHRVAARPLFAQVRAIGRAFVRCTVVPCVSGVSASLVVKLVVTMARVRPSGVGRHKRPGAHSAAKWVSPVVGAGPDIRDDADDVQGMFATPGGQPSVRLCSLLGWCVCSLQVPGQGLFGVPGVGDGSG